MQLVKLRTFAGMAIVFYSIAGFVTKLIGDSSIIPEPDLQRFIELGSLFQGITAIHYKAQVEIALNPKIFPKAVKPTLKTVEFFASGDRFLWTCTTDEQNGRGQRFAEGGWSGDSLQYLQTEGNSVLVLSKERNANLAPDFVNSNPFFIPFAFLNNQDNPKMRAITSISDLINKINWNSLQTIARIKGSAVVNNHNCTEFEFTRPDYRDDVYSASEYGGFPIKFERIRGGDGQVLESFTITSFQKAHSPLGDVYYPAEAQMEIYDSPRGGGTNRVATANYKISELEFNSPETLNQDYSISPSKAEKIFDTDEKVWIKTAGDGSSQ